MWREAGGAEIYSEVESAGAFKWRQEMGKREESRIISRFLILAPA